MLKKKKKILHFLSASNFELSTNLSTNTFSYFKKLSFTLILNKHLQNILMFLTIPMDK